MDDQLQPPTGLSPAELGQLRAALALKYPNARNVLGAQLGAFVREHLANADLKGRFGGLKNFVTRYFPSEIAWRGKQGLDDLYDVRFMIGGDTAGDGIWQPVVREASPWLWSSVTNPSTAVQFAWSPEARSLMRAPVGIERTEGLIGVEKLSKGDYQGIAKQFVASLGDGDSSRYLEAIEASESSVAFTTVMRQEGLLSKWEEFRVENAIRLFADRLVAAGVDADAAAEWADVLRLSQQQARAQRGQSIADDSRAQKRRPQGLRHHMVGLPETREVAVKTLEFLSETELSELRLPLGSVMRALRSMTSVG
jgi:hypothetical protein